MPINMTDYRMIINERVYNVLQIMIDFSCEYYESCGKPERYMKCMGYKERQQAAGKQKVDVQG